MSEKKNLPRTGGAATAKEWCLGTIRSACAGARWRKRPKPGRKTPRLRKKRERVQYWKAKAQEAEAQAQEAEATAEKRRQERS